VRIDTDDLQQLLVRTREFPPVLRTELRTELRQAAEGVQRAARRNALALRMPAVVPARHGGGRRSTGLRRGLAAAVRIRQRDAGDGVEYRIRAGHPMSSPTNSAGWRHPVYGNRGRWVAQLSQPWFSAAVRDARPEARRRAENAVQRAVRRVF
jgi:hypothetical protein